MCTEREWSDAVGISEICRDRSPKWNGRVWFSALQILCVFLLTGVSGTTGTAPIPGTFASSPAVWTDDPDSVAILGWILSFSREDPLSRGESDQLIWAYRRLAAQGPAGHAALMDELDRCSMQRYEDARLAQIVGSLPMPAESLAPRIAAAMKRTDERGVWSIGTHALARLGEPGQLELLRVLQLEAPAGNRWAYAAVSIDPCLRDAHPVARELLRGLRIGLLGDNNALGGALTGLSHLNPSCREIAPLLAELVQTWPQPWWRTVAIDALGAIGADSSQAAPALRMALQDALDDACADDDKNAFERKLALHALVLLRRLGCTSTVDRYAGKVAEVFGIQATEVDSVAAAKVAEAGKSEPNETSWATNVPMAWPESGREPLPTSIDECLAARVDSRGAPLSENERRDIDLLRRANESEVLLPALERLCFTGRSNLRPCNGHLTYSLNDTLSLHLVPLLSHPADAVRILAAEALGSGWGGPVESARALETALAQDRSVEVRVEAAWSLAAFVRQPEIAVNALRRSLREETAGWAIRAAVGALGRLGQTAGGSAHDLATLSRSGREFLSRDGETWEFDSFREPALWALWRIGPRALEAESILRALGPSRHMDVSEGALARGVRRRVGKR